MLRQTAILMFCFAFSPAIINGQNQKIYEELVLSHNDFSTYGIYSQSYDSSRLFYEELISKCEKYGYWDLAIGALNFLAYIADLNRHYDDMEYALEKGRIILREHKINLDSTDSLYTVRSGFIMQIALYYSRINKLEDAEQILLSLIEQLKEKPGTENITLFNVYARMADLYGDRGLYEKAYPYYLLMERTIPEGEFRDYYRFLLRQYMSTYYISIKDYHSARQTLFSALEDLKHKPVEGEWLEYHISYYELMGSIYQGLNQFDSAINNIRKAVSLQDPHSPTITYTYEIYGDCLANFKKFKGALYYYQKVDSIYRKSKSFSSFKRAQNLSKLSEAKFYLNDYSGALRSVQLAFYSIHKDSAFLRNLARNPAYSAIQPDKVLIKLLIVKSGSLSELSRTIPDKPQYIKASLETYKLASKTIDRFRHEISTDDFKQFFVSDIRSMYENAVNTCWQAWQTSKNDSLINLAFYFMEKSKYQVLLDAVNSDYAEASGKLPESIITTSKDYKSRLISLQNRITKLKADDDDSLQLSRVQIDFAKTRNSYEKFLNMIERKYPDYYNLRFNSEVPEIRELKSKIGNAVVVEYMTANSFFAFIAVNRNRSLFKLTPVNVDSKGTLSQLLSNLQENPYLGEKHENEIFNSYVNSAFGLFEVLFKPIKDYFSSADNFIIVSDGMLNYLPFDILLEKYPDFQGVNYRELDYLLKTSVIRYEYSASILIQNTNGIQSDRNRYKYIGFAPEYSRPSGSQIVGILGKQSSVMLRPLKFSADEIKAASSVFKGNVYTGLSAVADLFKESSASARIIHFAGHTFINDSAPELSCLLFSETPGDIADEKSDASVIYANEILNLNLNANLVMLSTCESGTGKLLKGEGLISIGRSFRYAGAQSMIMTMWKINDQSASIIINEFCRNIKKGRTSDISLRKAKLDFLSNVNQKNTHPFYWAAFVFIGDNGPVINRWRPGIILSLVLIFLLLTIYFILKRPQVRPSGHSF